MDGYPEVEGAHVNPPSGSVCSCGEDEAKMYMFVVFFAQVATIRDE